MKKLRDFVVLGCLMALGLVFIACKGPADPPAPPAPTTYTVTFSLNGGSGTTPAAKTVNIGSSTTLPSGSGLTRSGSTFGGWNTKNDGTGTNYGAGASFTPTASITLYAKWAVGYTVSFDINGGSGTTPLAQTGTSITLPSGNGLTKTGYTFDGWNTKADGTGTNYDAGASYTPTAPVTLHAKWIAGYRVSFNINGGNGTTPSAEIGTSITLPSGNDLSKTGYSFDGWNTNISGTGTNYSAGASYTPTASIILYARWVPLLASVTGLANKLAWLQTYAASDTSYTLDVNTNESIASQILSYSNRENITITLRGVDVNQLVSLSSSGTMFSVGNGVTLILDNNITLQGRNSNKASLINVNSGGTLEMNAGSKITGNTVFGSSSYGGGGVYVGGGTFTMNGGEITGNTSYFSASSSDASSSSYGGGVYVGGGTFTMNGGEITDNNTSSTHYDNTSGFYANAYSYGGGVYVGGGTFTMSDGEISGNTASASATCGPNSNSAYAESYGGGVCVGGGTFTMSGGEISGNTVTASYTKGSTFLYTAWARTYGGGVYVGGGTFSKTGGTISDGVEYL